MTKEVADEIVRWSGTSIFRIERSWINAVSQEIIQNDFRADFDRYYPGQPVNMSKVKYFPGLTATLLYRFSRFYFLADKELIALEFSSLAHFLTGIELFYSAGIGKGLRINHGMGLVVGARTTVGENCLFHQGVTLGDRNGGRPILGNHVTIYPGSSVLGAVTIGNNVIIGAHTLVFESVQENKIVVGNPNRIFDGKN